MRVYDEYHHYVTKSGKQVLTFGLVRTGPKTYEKCGDDCCKSGGYPSIWLEGEDDED